MKRASIVGDNALKPPALRAQAGSTLVGAVILVFVMLLSILSVVRLGAMDATLAVQEAARAEAFFLAESGLEVGQGWLEAQPHPPVGVETVYPFGESPAELGGGVYSVSILPDPHNPTMYPKIYTIMAIATVGSHSRCLELDLAPECFADFLYFTDQEHLPGGTSPIWFVTDDSIDGPLHTNDQIHISGDPAFLSHTRSAYGGPDDTNPSHNAMFMYYNGNSWSHIESAAACNPPHDYPSFSDGYTLGCGEVDLPESAMDQFRDEAQHGGIYIDGSRQIRFARNDPATGQPMHGYVSYRRNSWQAWTDVEIESINGVMYLTGEARILGGRVDGHLTIASDHTITIRDDVRYRDSDAEGPGPGCDDILGLVCSGDVIVADTNSNRDDCVIHADIIAAGGSFTVENWAGGFPRGTLAVHGGICQRCRGPVGTFRYQGGDVVVGTGYVKDYHFDERLLLVVPPGYEQILSTGRYRQLAWRDVCGS